MKLTSLERLIQPYSCDEFFAQYFEQKPALFRAGDRARFTSILSTRDVDRVLGAYAPRHPDITVVRAGSDIPKESYLWRGELVDPMRVARLYSEGATVILAAMHHYHEPLRLLCNDLGDELDCVTQANIYLTPKHSRGFPAHWDSHDVFIMQIEGRKRWQFFANNETQPLSSQSFNPNGFEPGDVVEEKVLEPGDVLYIPRGATHAALTEDEHSLHVTLGIMAHTWADFLLGCLAGAIAQQPTLRRALPFKLDARMSAGEIDITNEAQELLKHMLSPAVMKDALAKHRFNVRSAHRPRAENFLQQVMQAPDLGPTSEVRCRDGLSLEVLHDTASQKIRLMSGQREVTFPDFAERPIRQLISGKPVRVNELEGLEDLDSQVFLVSKLVNEGFLETLGSP